MVSADFDSRIRRLMFSEAEDAQLLAIVEQFGASDWSFISARMPGRKPRQCRDRWNHYLAPQANTSDWTTQEDDLLLTKLHECGNQWCKLSLYFPGRTGISIRNHCCKLARRKNADPILGLTLYGHSKQRLKCDIDDARKIELAEPGEAASKPLPSCASLLASVSYSANDTKLFPLFLKN
jgi:hypothetical protein